MTTSTTRRCPACSEAALDTGNFCVYCGAKLLVLPTETTATSVPSSATGDTRSATSASATTFLGDLDERRRRAIRSDTSPDDLRRLAFDPDPAVRALAARNSAMPVELLRELADDTFLREYIAENPAVPVDLLHDFVADADENIRSSVALNSAIPVDVLRILATDPDEGVRSSVAINPATPVDVLEALATDPEASVVAWNPMTPVASLRTLATHPDEYIRERVAMNPSTPVDVLQVLMNDPSPDVRQAAEDTLQDEH